LDTEHGTFSFHLLKKRGERRLKEISYEQLRIFWIDPLWFGPISIKRPILLYHGAVKRYAAPYVPDPLSKLYCILFAVIRVGISECFNALADLCSNPLTSGC